MKINDEIQINNYQDFLANRIIIFNLLEEVIDEIVKDMAKEILLF